MLIITSYLEILAIKLETQIVILSQVLIVKLVNNASLIILYMEIVVINVILRLLIV